MLRSTDHNGDSDSDSDVHADSSRSASLPQDPRLPASSLPPSLPRAAFLPSTHEATAGFLSESMPYLALAPDPPSGSLQVSLGRGTGPEFAFPGRVNRDRDPPRLSPLGPHNHILPSPSTP
eukprot:3113124-Rhodomonas_salina.2